jgi:hypothetical protein
VIREVLNYNFNYEDMPVIPFDNSILQDMLSNLVDILAKKLPADISFNPSKLDSVIHKIKLVPIPKGVYEQDVEEDPDRGIVAAQKNTGEKALVKINIPMKRVEEEEEVFS